MHILVTLSKLGYVFTFPTKITENFTLILWLLLSGWHHKMNVSKTGTPFFLNMRLTHNS